MVGLRSLIIQIAGIAPTLLVVRANVRKADEEEDDAYPIQPVSVARTASSQEEIVMDIS
ncbi:hypothetical protein AAF712_009214 [Marasmius tenuissimus]|uniref:Uncharacterized protein n=1 Tax=Marasmius tenuissimus TaxID=585030 RepID=A0ABR2ZQA9_9AGAR